MVSSINAAESSIQQLMLQMYQKMSAADTDGIAGLSKEELSSIDVGNDVGGAGFLQSLTAQFDKIDANGDGQLSAEEIAFAKPSKEPLGPPPGLELTSTGSSESTDNIMEKILKKLSEKFTDSYKKAESGDKSPANAIASLCAKADTDGVKGLSLDELSAVDTSKDTRQAGFINNLIENFKSIDTDGDGQLSQSELQNAIPKQFSKQEMAAMNNSFGSFGGLSNLSGNLVQKLLNSYQNGDLSKLVSSLSVAI